MIDETFTLGGSARPLTRLGMGGCPLGGHGWGAVDEAEARAAIAEALDAGVTLFDTADCYGFGRSEAMLAEVLGARRHDVCIATKFGVRWDGDTGRTWKDTSPEYATQALEASLGRLGLERIPLYFVHWPDASTPIRATMEELARRREQGKIEHIGVSNFTAAQLREAAAVTPVAAIQVRGSVLNRAAVEGIRSVADELKVPVVTWGSLGEGILSAKFTRETKFEADDRRSRYESFQGRQYERGLEVAAVIAEVARRGGRSPAQVALRWLLDTKGIAAALFGAKRPAQVRDNVGALGWRLAPTDYRRIDELTAGGGTVATGGGEHG